MLYKDEYWAAKGKFPSQASSEKRVPFPSPMIKELFGRNHLFHA
jgi:hypothetical protein